VKTHSQHVGNKTTGNKTHNMKTRSFLSAFLIGISVLFASCKDENPEIIPIQKTAQAPIELAGTSTLAILAGSAITNTGSTSVTGDMALSPGTSIGGFPPGILVGELHINDEIATQAKLDLTSAYMMQPVVQVPTLLLYQEILRSYTYPRTLQNYFFSCYFIG
jgi:hypothetical protein